MIMSKDWGCDLALGCPCAIPINNSGRINVRVSSFCRLFLIFFGSCDFVDQVFVEENDPLNHTKELTKVYELIARLSSYGFAAVPFSAPLYFFIKSIA